MTTEPDGLVEKLRAEAERLDDVARDLCLDAGSWRETADRAGSHAAGILMRDALKNERVAGEQEATAKLLREAADALSAAQRSTSVLAFVEEHIAAQVESGDEFARGWNTAMHNVRNKLLEAALLSEKSPSAPKT